MTLGPQWSAAMFNRSLSDEEIAEMCRMPKRRTWLKHLCTALLFVALAAWILFCAIWETGHWGAAEPTETEQRK